MNKVKFTKGEWIAVKGDGFGRELAITTKNRISNKKSFICEMDIYFDGNYGDEQVSNANLIAAAPEMYAMLKSMSDLMPLLDEQTHPQAECDALKFNIDDLLARARGDKP